MGLAGKLKADAAATSTTAPPKPPQQQPSYQAPPPQQQQQPPPSYQTAAAPMTNPNVQPYSQPSGFTGSTVGGGMTRGQQSSDMSGFLLNRLERTVQENSLQKFYSSDRLRQVQSRVSAIDWDGLAAISKELAMDLTSLALYDVILYVDDSGSMQMEEGGDRIEDAKVYCAKVSEIATLFDDDGILVRFINSNAEGNGITNSSQVDQLFSQVQFSGGTPIGTSLERKIIRPFVMDQQLNKPILVIAVTDGEPSAESRNTLESVITNTVKYCEKKYGSRKAITYMMAQVGKAFLSALDDNKHIADVVDTVGYYELEQMKLQKQGVNLTPEQYLVKLMLGAVDRSYD